MRILITCFLIHFVTLVQAQEIEADSIVQPTRGVKTNYFGVKIGGLASSFAHNSGIALPSPGKQKMIGWQAGLALDMFTQKNYNARVELAYNTKGAKETFSNDLIAIQTQNKLQYVQLSVLPFIVKHSLGKVTPYLGLGGYYARRVGIKSRWKPGTEWEVDIQSANNLNVKNDFGYSVSLGIYVWKKPFAEIRYEGGLNSVSSTSSIKNRSIVLSLAI